MQVNGQCIPEPYKKKSEYVKYMHDIISIYGILYLKEVRYVKCDNSLLCSNPSPFVISLSQ